MKFRLEKKLVVKVKYFEHLFFIRDEDGEALFAGADEARAREVMTLLNAYHNKKTRRLAPKKRPSRPLTKAKKRRAK